MISRSVKLGYASGQLGITAFEVFVRIQLLLFYSEKVGLRADRAGLAVGLAVIWDAVTAMTGLNTFSTILAVPHRAMAAELTQDSQQRLEIYGWRLAFGNMGAFL